MPDMMPNYVTDTGLDLTNDEFVLEDSGAEHE